MENILDSIEEENIANLFRLKNRVYNKTFKNYICIFKQIKNINFYINIKYENIDLDYEGSYESDGREKDEYLRIASNYLDVLTVDKRAMYIMALEIATAIDGQISEDDKKTWLRIDEFKEKHQDILSLTFDEANEMSLEEIQTIEAIDDPIWEELDRKREEYIRIHGEVELDDDEEDE